MNIQKHDIECAARKRIEQLLSVFCLGDLHVIRRQEKFHHFPVHAVVVGQKNAQASE